MDALQSITETIVRFRNERVVGIYILNLLLALDNYLS
ncbi:MAG: hypothetical protein JWN76_3798 [Chitinophagaceae bacterium]|nr:hypothetical protein [Chitinophagaceae bacterium]